MLAQKAERGSVESGADPWLEVLGGPCRLSGTRARRLLFQLDPWVDGNSLYSITKVSIAEAENKFLAG